MCTHTDTQTQGKPSPSSPNKQQTGQRAAQLGHRGCHHLRLVRLGWFLSASAKAWAPSSPILLPHILQQRQDSWWTGLHSPSLPLGSVLLSAMQHSLSTALHSLQANALVHLCLASWVALCTNLGLNSMNKAGRGSAETWKVRSTSAMAHWVLVTIPAGNSSFPQLPVLHSQCSTSLRGLPVTKLNEFWSCDPRPAPTFTSPQGMDCGGSSHPG